MQHLLALAYQGIASLKSTRPFSSSSRSFRFSWISWTFLALQSCLNSKPHDETSNWPSLSPLHGQCHEIFYFRFFTYLPWSPLKMTLGSFRIFSQIHGDIRKSRCTTGIDDTSVNETTLMGYSGVGEKLIHKKTWRRISWHCTLKSRHGIFGLSRFFYWAITVK